MKYPKSLSIWSTRIQIKGDVRFVHGSDVYYRLYEIKCPCSRKYVINVAKGNESATCNYGRDRSAAIEAYEKIVAFTVTPCTLQYIVHDLLAQAT